MFPCEKVVLDNYELHNADTDCEEAEEGDNKERIMNKSYCGKAAI